MTEQLDPNKEIIVYTITNNKFEIIGRFEDIDLHFRFPLQDEVPDVLPKETQVCFVLKNGSLKLNKQVKEEGELVTRSSFNITLDLVDFKDQNISTNTGRLDIIRCRFDSLVNGNIEGLAEGVSFLSESVEEFKNKLNNNIT